MAIVRDTTTGRLTGVDAEAKRLGCSKGHLWMVVKGQRQSKRLMKMVRIHDIKIREAQ